MIHTAAALPELVQALAQFRCRRGDDVGEPLREIIEQLCKEHPDYCRELPDTGAARKPKPPAKSPDGQVEQRQKPLEWRLAGWLRKAYLEAQSKARTTRHADRKTVETRAAVCKACPAYIAQGVSSCTVCKTTLEEVSRQLRAGRDTGGNMGLGACDAEGSDLRVDVLTATGPTPGVEYPKGCWKIWSGRNS